MSNALALKAALCYHSMTNNLEYSKINRLLVYIITFNASSILGKY